MKIADMGSAIFFLSFGVFVTWQSAKLPIGTFRAPGPGFFPYCLGLFLIGLSLVVFAQGMRKTKDVHEAGLRKNRVIIALAGIFAYAFIVEFLGYLLSSFILMFLLIKMMVKKSWWFAPVVACLISLTSYILFNVWLQVSLPVGFWGF